MSVGCCVCCVKRRCSHWGHCGCRLLLPWITVANFQLLFKHTITSWYVSMIVWQLLLSAFHPPKKILLREKSYWPKRTSFCWPEHAVWTHPWTHSCWVRECAEMVLTSYWTWEAVTVSVHLLLVVCLCHVHTDTVAWNFLCDGGGDQQIFVFILLKRDILFCYMFVLGSAVLAGWECCT